MILEKQDFFKNLRPSPSTNMIINFLYQAGRDQMMEDIKNSVGMVGFLLGVSTGNENAIEISSDLMGIEGVTTKDGAQEMSHIEQWMTADTPEEYRANLEKIKPFLD